MFMCLAIIILMLDQAGHPSNLFCIIPIRRQEVMLSGHGSDVGKLVGAVKAVCCTEKKFGMDDRRAAKMLVLLVSSLEGDLVRKVSMGHCHVCADNPGCCKSQGVQ